MTSFEIMTVRKTQKRCGEKNYKTVFVYVNHMIDHKLKRLPK